MQIHCRTFITADRNPELYLKFKGERTQPAIDLANRITLANHEKIIDIGCGAGNSTQILRDKFPNAYILGIDSSENMIKKAKSEHSDIEFEIHDANTDLDKLPGDFDIVFSNACIQWLPDHNTLLKKMFSLLRKGGMMAVQIPMNYEEPVHKIIAQMRKDSYWNRPTGRTIDTLSQEEYYDILSDMSKDVSVWQTTYFHILHSHEDILEWYRSTGLKPYLDELSANPELKAEFEKAFIENLKKQYPLQKDGNIIFRFPRFFFIAVK